MKIRKATIIEGELITEDGDLYFDFRSWDRKLQEILERYEGKKVRITIEELEGVEE